MPVCSCPGCLSLLATQHCKPLRALLNHHLGVLRTSAVCLWTPPKSMSRMARFTFSWPYTPGAMLLASRS